jgi:RelA/SpoT family (p)ppGpp synthetase
MEQIYEFPDEYDEQGLFGKDEKQDLELFLEKLLEINNELDRTTLEKAFWFCVNYHRGIKRKSGYPYYTHPLNVTLILVKELGIYDLQSIVAALLHDVIEDVASVSKSEVAREFSEEIAEIVDAVTKIDEPDEEIVSIVRSPEELIKIKKAETYRKLFLSLVKDVRVILIKLADRLHNLRTLHYLNTSKQYEVANETLNFYVPFAHRLGLNKVRMEMENRAFYYTDRKTYEAIKDALNSKRRDFIEYIKVFVNLIQKSLKEKGIEATITIVHKYEYEIFQMIKDGKSLEDIDNFYSLVIILKTDDVAECYRAHGILANVFNAISFADYVANPKLDWYRSLNTELFGPDGKRVEILIRTEEMEKIAEGGFAAKFSLKSGRIRALTLSDEDLQNWGSWMRDMILTEGDRATQIIWDSIKTNLFDSELTVFSKDGQAIKLPHGASLIDFAFNISEELGLHCISGKVNGIVRQLQYKLQNGDQVEIISSPNSFPLPEWKDFVVSFKAVFYLHKYFKHNSTLVNKSNNLKHNYDVKLLIRGDDREGMLMEITQAIGSSNIRRVNLDTSGNVFEGAIIVHIKDEPQLNEIFGRLLLIKGIRGVEIIEETN